MLGGGVILLFSMLEQHNYLDTVHLFSRGKSLYAFTLRFKARLFYFLVFDNFFHGSNGSGQNKNINKKLHGTLEYRIFSCISQPFKTKFLA